MVLSVGNCSLLTDYCLLTTVTPSPIDGALTAGARRLWHDRLMLPLRLLIIAAEPLARAGLAALLSQQPQLSVVGQVGPETELTAQLAAYQPDVVLWDLGWNPAPLLDALTEFSEIGPPLLTLAADEAAANAIWASGVRGLLRRDATGEMLGAALTALAHGLMVIDPTFAAAWLHPPAPSTERLLEPLTPRERQVLQALAAGLANKQIARQLEISEHTVKFHINAILSKLGAQSRTEAVVRATRAGLILL